MLKSWGRQMPTIVVGLLMVGVLFVTQGAIAQQPQPADKTAATGSDIDTVNDPTTILSETMRVSSPSDLILQLTAECSILTDLVTNNSEPSSSAFGAVRLWIEIDGKRVPVAADDTANDGAENENDGDGEGGGDIGEVTFCNRAYSRTVTDDENNTPPDGIDEEEDFIRTRTANAFNWLALNVGFDYDTDGDNVILIEVKADFDETTSGEAAADAFVGSRTLIVEPVHAAVNESVGPGPVETASPTPQGNGNGKP